MLMVRLLFGRMFYLFFESRENKAEDPIVLWMSGGPGCSSELALFYENGPFQITDNLTLTWNEHGWDKVCSIYVILYNLDENYLLTMSEISCPGV